MASPTAVMTEAFRQSFPPQHDLPPAMSALIAKLAALEEKVEVCGITSAFHAAEKQPLREFQMT
jgi:hypothetical protein